MGLPEEATPDGELVERGPETRLLAGLVDALERGSSSAVAVVGSPGTGRTTLLEYVASIARERNLQVLFARGSTTEARLPYGLVSQLLSAVPGLTDSPWLAEVLDDGTEDPAVPQMLCHRLLESARRRPMLLVVDDAHLIDQESSAWLTTLARRISRAPLMILVAHAGTASSFLTAEGTEEWQPAGLPWDSLHVVRLRPLSSDAVGQVVHAANTAGADPQRLASALFDVTRGNPALLRAVMARTSTELGPDDGLGAFTADARRDAVLGVVDQLPADLVGLLRVVAAGGTVDLEYLRPLAGPLTMPVAKALRLFTDLGLIDCERPKPMDPDVATWVLAGMNPAERALLRRAAAETSHRRAAPDGDVASLLLGAETIGHPWAVETLRSAAVQYREAGDHATAAACYQRALEEPLAPELRAHLRVDLETVEMALCPHTADLRLSQATASSGESESVRARLVAADLMILRGARENALRELAELSAIPILTDAERGDLCALYWLAQDNPRGSVALGIPALADVDQGSFTPSQAGVAAWTLARAGQDLRTSRRLARKAMEGWSERTRLFAPRLLVARTFVLTDDALEALSVYDGVVADATRWGARISLAVALSGRAWLHLQRGRITLAEEDLALAKASGPPGGWHAAIAGWLAAVTIAAGISRGDLAAAQRAADAIRPLEGELVSMTPYLLFMKGLLEINLKRHRKALHLFQECGRRMLAVGWINPSLLPWRSHVAIAYRGLGEERVAEALIAEEWELANAWGTRTAIGRTHLGAGIAVPSEDAVFRLTRAVHALQQSPSRVLYVEALILLATAQLNRSLTAGVARQLREAERLATAYQLGWALPRIRDLTTRLAERPPVRVTPRTAARRWRSLSPASADLVRMVLRGATNADIARSRSVSKRAVELRLTAIYRQLEITGRAELRELFAVLDNEF